LYINYTTQLKCYTVQFLTKYATQVEVTTLKVFKRAKFVTLWLKTKDDKNYGSTATCTTT